MIAVSHKNMPKMVPVSAPLHLCTPMALARRLNDEIEIKT